METSAIEVYRVSALNDLIRINNDRITGYKKRMSASLDDDLDELFYLFVYQSQQNIDELTQLIYRFGGQPVDGRSLSGQFYHAWMDVTATLVRQDRQTMLDYCEYGEDVAKSVYQKVLDDKEIMGSDIKVLHLLKMHLADLKRSHKLVKELRDHSANAA